MKSKLLEKNIETLNNIFKSQNIKNITKDITNINYPNAILSKLLTNQDILLEPHQIYIESIISNIYKLVDTLNNGETNKIDINKLYNMFCNNNINFSQIL